MPHPPPAGRPAAFARPAEPPSRRGPDCALGAGAAPETDRRPLRRGGRPSPETASAGRPAGFNRQVARRGLFPSAGVLAAAALVALSGALALPATAEAQTEITLVSNIGQGTSLRDAVGEYAQRFTTGSNASGYILTGVDVTVSATSTAFTAQVCAIDTSGHPTSTCTVLTAPSSVSAAGTASFTAPNNTTLTEGTTYTVKLTLTGKIGWTNADDEDAGNLAGWSIADAYEFFNFGTNLWTTNSNGRSVRMAIKGSAAVVGTNNAPVFADATATREVAENSAGLRLAGRGEKIHEMVCRCGGRVPIREVCRARSTTATIRTDLGVSGTLGTCGASNASNETRRS